jgi:chromosome segregation ATPase
MKPKAPNEHEDGLLEYLEDIIGTSKYKEPLEEGAKQLGEFNEQRDEKLTRLKFVEKDKKSLEVFGEWSAIFELLESDKLNTCSQKRLKLKSLSKPKTI